MAYSIISGFAPSTTEPIDSRTVKANATARKGMNSYDIYEGLVVYQVDTNQLWVLIDTANYNNDNGWQLVGSGAGGGGSWISGSASNTYVSSSATTVTTVVGGITTQTNDSTSVTFGVAVTGSTFTGSFVGNGSGLTGVVAAFPAAQQTTLIGTDKVYINDGTTNEYATVSQFNSASWAGVSGDISINATTGAATINANSVALGTDTTGNYVGDVTAGAGLTKSSTASEGQTVDLAVERVHTSQ